MRSLLMVNDATCHTALFAGFLFLSFVSVTPAFGQDDVAKSDRPNIVVIIADDLGYGETGMMGNAEIPTPNIDSLAADGVRCTAGYVTASVCSPSRAGDSDGTIPVAIWLRHQSNRQAKLGTGGWLA